LQQSTELFFLVFVIRHNITYFIQLVFLPLPDLPCLSTSKNEHCSLHTPMLCIKLGYAIMHLNLFFFILV